MCVIAYAPPGVEIKEETIRKMFENNWDGAGVMYKLSDNDPVEIRKGFKSAEALIAAYRKIPVDVEKAVHCRLRSAGPINDNCCHPFPVRENIEDIMAKEDCADVALMHNGTIKSCMPKGAEKDKVSDTMIFTTRHLSKWKDRLDDTDVQNKIKGIIDISRLLIFRSNGKTLMFNKEKWYKADGVYYSKDISKYR